MNKINLRGFASMDPQKQREIASRGGKSVPAHKRSFSQDRRLAMEAGRKGGSVCGTTKKRDQGTRQLDGGEPTVL
jgi:general stress protein YciG